MIRTYVPRFLGLVLCCMFIGILGGLHAQIPDTVPKASDSFRELPPDHGVNPLYKPAATHYIFQKYLMAGVYNIIWGGIFTMGGVIDFVDLSDDYVIDGGIMLGTGTICFIIPSFVLFSERKRLITEFVEHNIQKDEAFLSLLVAGIGYLMATASSNTMIWLRYANTIKYPTSSESSEQSLLISSISSSVAFTGLFVIPGILLLIHRDKLLQMDWERMYNFLDSTGVQLTKEGIQGFFKLRF